MISIDVAKALMKPGEPYEFSYTGSPEFEDLAFAEPLVLHATYSGLEDGIRIKGSFNTAVETDCTRCLAKVEYPVQCDFEELFMKEEQCDDDCYTYSGEQVSLDKMVYDMILLAIPQQVLCKPDCAGLCGKCGANLNSEKCKCSKDDTDDMNPFAVLKDWK